MNIKSFPILFLRFALGAEFLCISMELFNKMYRHKWVVEDNNQSAMPFINFFVNLSLL